MKKFLLLFVLILGSTLSFGQPVTINNSSSCDMFVHLYEFDAACIVTTTMVFVPAGTITLVSPTASGSFELAVISETFLFSGSCYYVKVQVPGATCVSIYPLIATRKSCCKGSPLITSDFNSFFATPGAPYLLIN